VGKVATVDSGGGWLFTSCVLVTYLDRRKFDRSVHLLGRRIWTCLHGNSAHAMKREGVFLGRSPHASGGWTPLGGGIRTEEPGMMRWHLTPEHKPARDAEDTRSAARLRMRGRTIVGATEKSSVPAKSKSMIHECVPSGGPCLRSRYLHPSSRSCPVVLAQLLRSASRDSRIHIHGTKMVR